jgi:hypothetical protein
MMIKAPMAWVLLMRSIPDMQMLARLMEHLIWVSRTLSSLIMMNLTK